MDSGIIQNLLWATPPAMVAVASGLLVYHSSQKKKEGRVEAETASHLKTTVENERQIEAQWRRYKEQSDKIAEHKTDIEVLKAKLAELPTGDDLQDKLDRLETKIVSQLRNLMDRTHCSMPGCAIHDSGRRD